MTQMPEPMQRPTWEHTVAGAPESSVKIHVPFEWHGCLKYFELWQQIHLNGGKTQNANWWQRIKSDLLKWWICIVQLLLEASHIDKSLFMLKLKGNETTRMANDIRKRLDTTDSLVVYFFVQIGMGFSCCFLKTRDVFVWNCKLSNLHFDAGCFPETGTHVLCATYSLHAIHWISQINPVHIKDPNKIQHIVWNCLCLSL